MDEIEDETTDLREQIFHNNVREQIVSYLFNFFFCTELSVYFSYNIYFHTVLN